jgi:hypothetical protein
MKPNATSIRRWLWLAANLTLLPLSLQAGPRTSASYTIVTDTADAGGRRATSASYTNDGSVGLVAGLSTVAAPAETVKHGYIGQLYDVTGLVLSATPTTVNEGGTLPLSAAQLLDDATTLSVPAASVTWSVAAGPLTGINASGLATAGNVYANTAATAQGNYAGNSGTLALTVLNVNLDNFGAYAGDTLDDAWQVQYFGQPPNVNAAPLVDFDRDGQNNAFEYTAGLIPTDANSVFRLRLEAVPGQPSHKRVIFTPRLTDRTYTVKAKPSLLTGVFAPLDSSTFTDNAQERTVTDLSATGATKFYQVEITRP